jgi:iron complex transport system substrate-binding protein
MKKRMISFTILVLIVLTLIGCNKTNSSKKEGIVVTSPEVAELIYELGGMDRIIARTDYCDYPEAMKEIESVGDFSSVNIERIISLNPEYVYAADYEQKKLADQLKPFNIRVETVHTNSIINFFENTKELADQLGYREQAAKIIKSFITQLKALDEVEDKPKVYFELSPNLGTVTNNSFIGDMIDKSGGINIFGDIKKDFLIAKNEDILAANPDVIIALSGVSVEEIIARKGWNNISAVKNKQIFTSKDLDPNVIMRCVPRSIEAIKKMNKIFKTYDVK